MKCDNRQGKSVGALNPTCLNGEATFEVTVYYFNSYETDKFYLCSDCKKLLIKKAKKNGHKVSIRTLA